MWSHKENVASRVKASIRARLEYKEIEIIHIISNVSDWFIASFMPKICNMEEQLLSDKVLWKVLKSHGRFWKVFSHKKKHFDRLIRSFKIRISGLEYGSLCRSLSLSYTHTKLEHQRCVKHFFLYSNLGTFYLCTTCWFWTYDPFVSLLSARTVAMIFSSHISKDEYKMK